MLALDKDPLTIASRHKVDATVGPAARLHNGISAASEQLAHEKLEVLPAYALQRVGIASAGDPIEHLFGSESLQEIGAGAKEQQRW